VTFRACSAGSGQKTLTACTFRARLEIARPSNEAIVPAKVAAPRFRAACPRGRVSDSIPSFRSAREPCRRTARAEDGSRPGSSASPPAAGADLTPSLEKPRRFPGKRFPVITPYRYPPERREAHPITRYFTSTLQRSWAFVLGEAAPDEMGLPTRGTWTGWAMLASRLARGTTGRRHRHPPRGAGPAAGVDFLAVAQHAPRRRPPRRVGPLHLVAGGKPRRTCWGPRDPRYSPGRREGAWVEVSISR